MRKRLLSLFLAVIMILLAVPTLAIVSLAEEAGTGTENKVVYSTSFSNDPTSENFPSIDLPAATDESTYVWNGLDFSGVGNFNEDGSFKSGNYKAGAITYKGNWEIGTIGVDWDATGTAAPTVNAESFYPYTDFYRASATEICITTGNAIWGTGNAVQSGGLWLNSARNSMIAGIVYNTTSPANNRLVTNYVGTAAVRYTTEYAGTIDISAVAGVAYRNGVSLVILHNGTVVHTVNNTDMTTEDGGTDLGTVKSGLAVEKGDTIDFVCLGDVNYDADSFAGAKEAAAYQGDAFDYNKTKRGIREFAFTLDYTSVGLPYTSTFEAGNENYPVSDTATATASFPGAWSVGALSASATSTEVTEGETTRTDYSAVTLGTKFTPYTYLETATSHCGAIVDSAKSTWNSYEDGRGGGFGINFDGAHGGYQNMMMMGVLYNKTDATPDTAGNDGNASPVYGAGIYATPSVRYTAEYTGSVTLSFDVSYPYANGTKLVILKNGAEVASYAYGTKTGTKDITVTAGDIIDFVSVPDLNYDYDSYAAYNYSTFNYGAGKRGLVVNSLSVTYDAGYELADIVDVWDGENSASIHHATTNTSNSILYFFAWYKADGTRVSPGYSAFDATHYAVPNPDLITAGVFTADDTYEEAMTKYRAYLKSLSFIIYNNWQMGQNSNGKFDAILYPSFLDQKTPFMVRTPSAGGYSFEGMSSSRWVSEDAFDEMFKGFYEATWTWYSGTTRPNTTIPTKDTKIADVKVTFSDDISIATAPTYNDDGSQKTPGNSAGVNAAEGYGKAKAPTTAADAVGGVESECFNTPAKIFYTRSATNNTSTVRGGSIAYTAPKAGTLKLQVNSVAFVSSNRSTTENLDTVWALYINGARVTDFATATNTDGADPAAQINAGIAAYVTANGDITVNKGDIVEIVTVRGTSGGTHVRIGVTATLTPTIGVAANLVINDSYAMNLYVEPVDSNAGAAGVIVENEDGTTTKMAGVKQTEGAYKGMFKVAVAEEIAIHQLAGADTAGIAAPDNKGIVVNYTPWEISGSYIEGDEMSSNTLDLLNAYMASSDAKVAELAKAIRSLAVASRAVITNKGGVDQVSKSYLKQGNPTVTDNNSSCPLDVFLASLGYYTKGGDLPAYFSNGVELQTNENNLFGIANFEDGVPYGYAEGVDPKTFAYTIAGANVNLGDKLEMVFLVSANGENNVYDLKKGYRLKISGADKDYYGDFYSYELNGKAYMAVSVDVPVKYYNTNLTITVVDANDTAVSAEMTYSVTAWCARVFNPVGTSNVAYTVKAVYMLGRAAAAYAAN